MQKTYSACVILFDEPDSIVDEVESRTKLLFPLMIADALDAKLNKRKASRCCTYTDSFTICCLPPTITEQPSRSLENKSLYLKLDKNEGGTHSVVERLFSAPATIAFPLMHVKVLFAILVL